MSADVVFFDLDGTLVDTAPDLAHALNLLLSEQGRPALDYQQIRPVASDGTIALLELGFNITPEHAEFAALQQRYIKLYQQNITTYSTLFDGIADIIDAIENHDKRWGVITNKPTFLTEALMQGLALSQRAVCLVSGDTTPFSKPHPAPMLHACELASVSPENCLYVGDARRDIDAGNSVNMTTIAAAYGYIHDHDDPQTWQANAIIQHPGELLQWL